MKPQEGSAVGWQGALVCLTETETIYRPEGTRSGDRNGLGQNNSEQ